MKLALIRQRYNAFGGAERFVEQAMAAMAAEGAAAVTLVAREWRREGRQGAQDGQVTPERTPERRIIECNPFYLGRTWRDLGFARAACRATRSGFDLVQSHERIACCDVYRAGDGVHAQWLDNRSRSQGRLARVATRFSPWHRYTLAAERRLYASPQLKAVICNSAMVAAEIHRHFGLDPDKTRLVRNCVDAERFHPGLKQAARGQIRARLGIDEAAFVFLLVGSGFMRKGVPQLLQAMRAAPLAHVIVVGADRRLAAERARADALGLGSRAHFPGPQREIEAWYAAADCFALPTLYDPFPNAALEAMASGLPVITSRQCGAAELVEPAGCGWACDAPDAGALAALLTSMVALPEAERAEMGRRARSLAETFTPRAMAAQLADLYREVLAAPAR